MKSLYHFLSHRYVLNCILTSIIFWGLMVCFNVVPFGNSTLLTIDMGQQYVDFFGWFRHTLLHEPSQIIYSFQKSIGGEMIGLWAYYLLSPFNLILLFFKQENMALGITFLTYLKITAMSLSFQYFCYQKYSLSKLMSITFSLSYAFMSYVITYWLNIMWLDGLILMPIIALGLHRLIVQKRPILYVISLSLALIIQYYIGYMICLFLIMYTLFEIAERTPSINLISLKSGIYDYLRFVYYSVISAGISAVVLVPTYSMLLSSKASHTSITLNFNTSYSIQDIFAKLFTGSFTYNEIKGGSAILYTSALIIVLSIAYFFNKKISLSEKLVALLISVSLLIAFQYDFFNQLWHGGQYPVWYHYRFSFLASFFMIVMAIKAYQQLKESQNTVLTFIIIAIITGSATYYLISLSSYPFLMQANIYLTLILAFLSLFILYLTHVSLVIRELALLLVIIVDLTLNATSILSHFSYVNANDYRQYTMLAQETIALLPHDEAVFFRTYPNFGRTKNESLSLGFKGLATFSSTIEASLPQLFGYLGLPSTSGSVSYASGTLFTDDFFGIRYILQPKSSTDSPYWYTQAADYDLAMLPLITETSDVLIYENPNAFSLGFEISNAIFDEESHFQEHQPIQNQELLLSLLDVNSEKQSYFTQVPLTQSQLVDVEITKQEVGDYITYQSLQPNVLLDKGSLFYEFDITSNNPYYFTLPSQIDHDEVALLLNTQDYPFVAPFLQRQLTSAAYQTEHGTQTLQVILKKPTVTMNQFYVYEFDSKRYAQLQNSMSQRQLTLTHFSHTTIEGIITIQEEDSAVLFTIPYDKNWRILIDEQPVTGHAVLNDTLLAVPISKGTHTIQLKYFPNSIVYGSMISVLNLGVLIISLTYRHRHT